MSAFGASMRPIHTRMLVIPEERPRIRFQLKATITSERVRAARIMTRSGTWRRAPMRVRNQVKGKATAVVIAATRRHTRIEYSVRPM